jgi:hypothetical protein
VAEYLIKKSTLDEIASQSMSLVGKTEAVSTAEIIDDLTDVNTEVGGQAELIKQIASVLKGKAGGSASPHDELAKMIIERSATEIICDDVTYISEFVFSNYFDLVSVSFPNVIGITDYAFLDCESLKRVDCKETETISMGAFSGCSKLKMLDFPKLSLISSNAFYCCTSLDALILRSHNVCVIVGGNPFSGSAIENGIGYIYVPSSLLNEYKTADVWSDFESQFRALEDYTVDGTIDGDLILDAEKIMLQVILYDADADTSPYIPVAEIYTLTDMTWNEWISSEYNTDGLFTLSDNGYVLFMDNFVAVDPSSGSIVYSDMTVDYMGEDNAVLVFPKEMLEI